MGTAVKVSREVQPALRELAGRHLAQGHRLDSWDERELPLAVRAFLLGHHGRIVPGHGARLPGSATGMGRID